MGDYGRDRRPGGTRSYGKNNYDRRSHGSGNRGGSREMFKAVCNNCGKDCEVPFRPTGSKPVLCSDCFEKSGSGRSRGSDRGSQYSNSNEILEQINSKLDNILVLLSKKEESKIADKEERRVKKEKSSTKK